MQLFLSDKKNGNLSEESFQALIDPGSYSSDKSSIVSYVSENYYNKIKDKYSSFIVGDCSCSPTKTCTAVGCFTSTNCVNLSCILSANNITTEEILTPFRIVKSLPINELIIGANYEVIRFLTACVADVDVRANWPTYIPFVQRIINTMIKTSTGVSPTELLYGNTIDHDSTFMLKPKEKLNIQTTYVEHMSNLLKIQEKVIKIVKRHKRA